MRADSFSQILFSQLPRVVLFYTAAARVNVSLLGHRALRKFVGLGKCLACPKCQKPLFAGFRGKPGDLVGGIHVGTSRGSRELINAIEKAFDVYILLLIFCKMIIL